MLFITGDTHGSYRRLRKFFRERPAGLLVILGDSGLSYYGDERDRPHRESAARLPLPLLCLRGNHDRRPERLAGLKQASRLGGLVYVEEAFPEIMYAVDGEIYDLLGFAALAIGGAYSIDKHWRLAQGYNWFADEQLSAGEMRRIEGRLERTGWRVDLVLTHTCPLRFEPREAFFEGVDQSSVDKSMEAWLDRIEQRLDYRAWYCGHYHLEKAVGKLRFLYNDVVAVQELPPGPERSSGN